MNFDHLTCFLSLCDTLSFTTTAKKLNLTQPSISRQLQMLEEQVGAKLFYRDKRQVRITPEGAQLKSKLKPIYEQMNEVLSKSSEAFSSASGIVNYGCLPEIGKHLFMDLIIRFQKKYKDINIHTSYMLDDDIIAAVKEGTLDIGIIRNPVISENIRTYKIIDEASVLVTRTQNNSKVLPLASSYFITYAHSDALLIQFIKTHFPKSDLNDLKQASSVNSHQSMIDLLLSRDSFAVLPYFSVKAQIQKGLLKIVLDKEIHTTIYLTLRETDPMPKRIDVLAKYLIAEAKNTPQI